MQHEMCSRQRIVAAARHLFATQGFHQTAMADLASAAGVSVGQIYRLFAGKSDLILAIVHEDADDKLAEMTRLCDKVTSGEETVEAGFTQLAARALSKGDEALSFEILAEAHRNADVAATIAKLCGRYRSIIRELACAANPRLSDAELAAAEELLLAVMFGLGHRALSCPALSVEETAQQTARMILAALDADDPIEQSAPSISSRPLTRGVLTDAAAPKC
ncbi:TetR/AcrR family transcriptional regulator [Sphingomonas koreensis]|nr:TetR/AcrR family transcriptional regulator [Sphingomonas koreensis]